MPAGCDSTRTKLRSISPAPTSNSAASATSVPIRANRTQRFTDTGERPPSRNLSPGSSPATCHAGMTPARIAVATHTPAVKSNTGKSSRARSVPTARNSGGVSVTSNCTAHHATTNPTRPPRKARTRLSVNVCRSSRARAAPTAARIAISRRRPAPRANSRFATFVQAINSRKTPPT